MNKIEKSNTRDQEVKLFKKSFHPKLCKANRQFCHPELYKANRRGTSLVSLYPLGDSGSKNCRVSLYPSGDSESVHSEKWKLPWDKMLKQVQHDKWAFTLAEVLITLGIIGVVSAITIPNIMSNYRKHVVETRLVKFYTTTNQAIKLAEVDYGDKTSWDKIGVGWAKNEDGTYDTTKNEVLPWFEKYLKPYMKYSHDEVDNDDGRVLVYLLDGSMVRLCSDAFIFYPNGDTYKKIKDKKIKEFYGKNAFTFYFQPSAQNKSGERHKNMGVEPYKYGWTLDKNRDSLFNNSAFGCKANPVKNQGAYCTALIQMNGWKIPKDYPIKF